MELTSSPSCILYNSYILNEEHQDPLVSESEERIIEESVETENESTDDT